MLADLPVEILDLGIMPDDTNRLRAAVQAGAAEADVVITSGGVAVGDFDLMKRALGGIGDFDFWQIAAQPAKPLAFGSVGTTVVFGLPGNPVAAAVAFDQLVRPALLTAMGANEVFRARIPATMGEAVATNPDKVVFLRVRVHDQDERCVAVLSGSQRSADLSGLADADAFAVIPVGVGKVDAGDPVLLELFGGPETRTAEQVLGRPTPVRGRRV